MHAWAATVVFAATGRPPYGTGPGMAIMDRVRRGEHRLADVPEPMRAFLAEALAPDPLDRPSVPEARSWLREQREAQHLATGPRPGGPDQWTMPFAPRADPTPTTESRTPEATPSAVPLHQVAPLQAPAPLDASAAAPAPPHADPSTRVLPPVATASATRLPEPWHAPPPAPSSRPQQLLQLLGLGALTASAVAYAPYLGVALVGVVVLLLRTASVTRQRHGRRQMIRGRATWYDVPTTTLSTPGYLLLALLGAVTDLVLAMMCGLAMYSIGYLAGQPPRVSLVLAGLGFVPALWWGPGSGRLREVVRGLVVRTARSEFGGWFVVAMCALGTAVLLGLLFGDGPNWAPQLAAPWR